MTCQRYTHTNNKIKIKISIFSILFIYFFFLVGYVPSLMFSIGGAEEVEGSTQ